MPEITQETIDEIKARIENIFTSEMEVDDFTGDTVPSINDLPDKNKGLIITNCTILFVDIRSSTELSDRSQAKSMAKIYRAFARAMSMCIFSSGGRVRQIVGDRVMGVFVDDEQESSVHKALHAARAIITVVENVFNPLCRTNVNNKTIECGVGIDCGRVLTASIGIKHDGEDTRDLVWAGKIANVASKHTDLAVGREIFVTNRFYNKLSASFKKNGDGEDIWKKSFRIKGNSIFEGYAIVDYYLNFINEQTIQPSESSHESIKGNRIDETELSGINEGEIIANIVEGVQKKTQDLLDRFESVIERENSINLKEDALSLKTEAIAKKERDITKKESELKEKENQIDLAIEYAKNKAIYEVKTLFFRENINSFSVEDSLSLMQELQKLGETIGKNNAEYKLDLFHWKLVRYFKERNETTFAYKIIIEQLTSKLSYISLPFEDDIVSIVKQLGKEREYLEVVLYHIKNFNPQLKKIMELRNILKKLGIESQIAENNQLLITK